MNSSLERLQRRRRYRSPSSYDVSSSQDVDEIEQDIIDRAMDIERSRAKSLRRQFEYIVHNIKKLERRRLHQYHRPQSPDSYERRSSPSRHRSFDPYRYHSYQDSSSERFDQPNDSRHSEARVRPHNSVACQVTMNYRGLGNEKHGDEIMVLQEDIIVFKGFLRPEGRFTFKFERRSRRVIVKLEFFINELFECCLSIDCEREQIDQENDLFQLEHIQTPESKHKSSRHEQRQISETDKPTSPNQHRRHRSGHTSKTNGDDRHHYKSNQDRTRSTKGTSYVKPSSQRSSSPPQSPPIKQRETSKAAASGKSEKPKANSTLVQSPVQTSKRASATEHKASAAPETATSNNTNDTPSKQNASTKPSYGPPQLSLFTRSDSDSTINESPNAVKQENEKASSSSEIAKQSESPPAKKDSDDEEEEGGDGEGLGGFLQLLQAMSGGGVSASPGNDDADGIQGLLARLGIVTQTTSRKSQKIAPRQVGNVENFLLVYLDDSTPDDSILTKCRGLVNYLKIFDDADDCVAFINTIANEKVLFIVSDALGDPVVSRIQDLQQLFAIYILCETAEQVDSWSTNQPKIHGLYIDINEIFEQIRCDIDREEENLLTFSYTTSVTKVKEEPGFVINHFLREILLDSDEMNDAKKELIDFCQKEYENNEEQLENIKRFENEYQKENCLEFFQRGSFLYKMLNKAFRVPEVDILFKLRLFIQHLHQLILSSSSHSSLKTLYRSQIVTGEQVEILKKCADGGHLSFSHFFLASAKCPETRETDDENEEIVFQIDVSNSNCYMSFNDQFLVTFGLVMRIKTIEKDNQGRSLFHLTIVKADDQQLENVIEPMKKEIRAPYPALRLVKLFIELEQYLQAIHLGQVLLVDSPGARKDPLLALARAYHSLGTTLYEKEDFDQALEVIKKSHELYLLYLPEDAPQLSPTWNNMGSIYLRQGKTDLALEHHERALAIQLKSPSPDLPSIISYSNNIGGVYLKLERYSEALVHFQRALKIEEQILPANHPELAGTYHRIGGVYFRQNEYEKALEYYSKTLEVELISLPDNHPTVAVTYHNRGTAFEGLGRLEEAVESAEKAVERLLKTLPKEHPQVRMNQGFVDKLKQKLWVKQLFTS